MLVAYMVVITHLAGKGAAAGAGGERDMNLDLPLIFAVLMGVAVLAYVVLDGYDLGVGMLMPAADAREQDVMVASIGPFWDANETWLVLGVGILLVAFPVAHGVVLGALYLPVAAMLIGLMLRGVAFEFRVKAAGLAPRAVELAVLARLVPRLVRAGAACSGATSPASSPASATCCSRWWWARALCGGYVLLGATWLVYKTEGDAAEEGARLGALGPAVGGARRRRW